jgi:hypothetical protein
MLYNRVPKVWTIVAEHMDSLGSRSTYAEEPRLVEVS